MFDVSGEYDNVSIERGQRCEITPREAVEETM